MKRLILSLFMTLAICLSLTPITVMAADRDTVYVGGVGLTGSTDFPAYAKTDESGNVSPDGADENSYNIKWDGTTLTLKDAYVTGQVNSGNIAGAAIGVENSNGAELTIRLEGSNTVSASVGIYVHSSGGNTSLTITGSGSLDASVSINSAIRVQSNGGNATLSIENAKVTATASSSGEGVLVQSAVTASASLTVNGGGLTASGNAGIQFWFGSGISGSGTPSLNVSNNAIVRANGGISTNSTAATPSGTGIVFDNGIGTVYGSVTLQENITIGEGESLTIPDGASLNTGSHEVIVNGGTLTGGDKIMGTVKYAPTITTESLPDGTVGTAYSQTLVATGSDNITWSINSGSLPHGLTLNSDTGVITGTPATSGSYPFAVKAENTYGSKTKELTITINDAKTYSASVTPNKITLPSVKEGYDPQDPEYITIKNTGNQTIRLEDHGEIRWLTITLDKNTLKPNEEAKVSIKLKDGLSAETRSTLKGFITYTSEDGTYRDYAHFEVTYEIRHNMKHVEAKEATHLEEGNIEYWYCEYCDKYYEGALGTNELSLEDITIPKLADHTPDSKKTNGTKTSAGLGIGLFSSLAGVSAVGAGILLVLKKRNDK